jgi:hypothetical protein
MFDGVHAPPDVGFENRFTRPNQPIPDQPLFSRDNGQ